jgi:aspartyl-tRNA(Asn)/glutamyl-tRNA(Gln) amidotransferase subunit A
VAGILDFSPDDRCNAFITTCAGAAFGDGALAGIAVAINDNISTAGIQTTCASRILEGYIPPYDAHAVELLKQEGAAIVGKTNMDEFGMGSTTGTSAFGPTRNPIDPERVPGGSSGGSAAAVAAGLVPMALGTDADGSIRCPAAFCGIVGLKPTYGRVSRYGLIAHAGSLEQIGPMARTVEDVSRLISVITRYDPRDSMMLDQPYSHRPSADVSGLKIGIPTEYFGEGVDMRIATTVRDAIDVLEGLGAETTPVSIPSVRYAPAACCVICASEVSSNLARFDGVRYGPAVDTRKPWHEAYREVRQANLGPEARLRIMLGTLTLSAGYAGKYYAKALAARQRITRDFERVFCDVDVIAGPTTPTVAFRPGEKVSPLSIAGTLTAPANLAGIPAISVPCGDVDGLPVGLQVMGRRFEDERVIDVAYAYEQEVRS